MGDAQSPSGAAGEPASLSSVLITDELNRRPARDADIVAENAAYVALAQRVENAPETILTAYTDLALELCRAGTAGISLLESDGGGPRVFRWTAMSGALATHVGASTPSDWSPCGVCLAQARPVLFSHLERRFTYFRSVGVPFVEGLLLPFEVDGRQAGTIWIATHDATRRFDLEDVRILTRLAALTGATYALAAARARTETPSGKKDEHLAKISHELRTPSHAIGDYAGPLAAGARGPLSADQRNDVQRILASQRHTARLLNDLIAFSQMQASGVHLVLERIALRDSFRDAEAIIAPVAADKQITLSVELPDPEIAVEGDRERLRQVLENLLTNAVKYTDRAGRVSLRCVSQPNWVDVEVGDTGVGIPTESLQAIFKPFVQLGKGDSSVGIGLGLSIAQELVRAMGGSISAESAVGLGSTFVVRLRR